MKRMLLSCSALLAIPLLSGCCSCGGHVDPCCGYAGGGSYRTESYSECLPAYGGHVAVQPRADCNNCQGDGGFALPPATSSPAPQAMLPGYPSNYSYAPGYNYPAGAIPVGPETIGPEIVTGPGDYGWTYQNAPPMGAPTPATPYSYSTSTSGPSALLPPAPIPSISNSVVVPPPAANTAQPGASVGPMMPPVPPPPAEPVSQMRYRRYR